MDFLSKVAAAAIPSCVGPVLKNIAYPFKVSDNVKALDLANSKLTAKQADVKNRVENDERHGLTQTNQVVQWLGQVDTVKGEIDEIKKRYQERSRCLGTRSFNCCSNYLISKGAMKKLMEVQELCEEGGKFDVVASQRPPDVPKLPLGSKVVAPNEEANLQEILRYIDNGQFDIIGIWGMGGVGKTRLLHLVYNSCNKGSSAFDVVVKITASKGCSVEKLQAELCEKCGFGRETNVELQASIISNNLSNRNFLILLDDLWDHIDLQSVGITFPLGLVNQFKRKVVMTTRFESVCGLMGVKKSLKVVGLDLAHGFRLFKENVGDETINFHPLIPSLAVEVVKELDGLPLALITIGRSMSNKRDPREWRHAIDLLKNSRSDKIEIASHEGKIYYKLKFSYDHLESPELRNCFLACSLWPEDYIIDKIDLIKCWLGLGLLDSDISHASNIYNPGYVVIGKLLSACLLEEVNSKGVKMHDVIRDMALWLAHDCGKETDKWVVQTGAGANQLLHQTNRWCYVERATLFKIPEESVNPSIPCDANSLQFLMISKLFEIGQVKKVIANLRSFCSLTFINMPSCKLSSFPQDISNLVNLRHLDLSWNVITCVPEELKLVRNLRYLFLQHNSIASFPQGVITELKELIILDLFGNSGEYLTWLIKELECLGNTRCLNITLKHPTHFKSLLELSNLPIGSLELNYENETDTFVIPSSFLGNSRVQDNLYKVEFKVKSVSKIVIESNPQSQLSYLDLLLFFDMGMEMIEWGNLAPEDLLPMLGTLYFWDCGKLKDVSWSLYLPCLRDLQLRGCDNVVQLFGVARATKPAFPSLIKLILSGLRNLEIFCDQSITFPSLEEIEFRRCPMLKKLPFKSNTIPSKLRIIVTERECWERLEWEDNGLKQTFQPLVKFWEF